MIGPQPMPLVGEYLATLDVERRMASYAIRVGRGDSIPRMVGPFSTEDEAWAWNDAVRDGADCVVVALHHPEGPHREPPR